MDSQLKKKKTLLYVRVITMHEGRESKGRKIKNKIELVENELRKGTNPKYIDR